MLHTPIYSDVVPKVQREIGLGRRLGGFEEVVEGLSEADARYEAQRCLSCGNCFECDHCYAACPEHAIVKLGKGLRYEFDYNKRTGCAECFEQCPCRAIEVVAEPALAGSR